MNKPKYADLGDLKEDARIDLIATAVLSGQTVGFIVDDTPGVADRYCEKLMAKVPSIAILQRIDGPVPNVVTLKVALRTDKY